MVKFSTKKTKKGKEKKVEQLGSVCILIGKEEKEVQNLHLRTTVNEVISALIKEEEQEGQDARNWVIVESWRGIERPLPPRTRLLKVWNSWKNEQRFVKFYLKKSSSISFRHNQPSKSLRNRRKRPNFIGAQETFIDGPFEQSRSSAATSESTSGTTTSGDTFGSPSELSLTTTTTTTTESNDSSDTDHHSKHSTCQDQRLRLLVSQCVERAAEIEKMGALEAEMKDDIDVLERELREETMRVEFEELSDQINLVEERISSLNNVAAGIQMNIFHEQQRTTKLAAPEDDEKARAIQTKIEAHLFVNLQLAAESDSMAEELAYLERSISSRMALLDQEVHFGDAQEIEDQILSYVNSRTGGSLCAGEQHDCPECLGDEHMRLRKTSSTTTDSSATSGHCSASSFDNTLAQTAVQKGKTVHFDSDSSLPDSDSAVSSISSSEFNRLNGQNHVVKQHQPAKLNEKYVRETLV